MKALEHIQDIGAMDEVIDILRPTSSFNDYGEEIITFTRVAQVFSAFEPRKTGSESFDGEQITAHHTADVTIRFFQGLNEKWRLVRRSDMTDWNIERIDPIGRQRFMTITATKAT